MCVRVPVLAFSKKFQHSTGERPGDGAGSGGGLLDRVVCRAGHRRAWWWKFTSVERDWYLCIVFIRMAVSDLKSIVQHFSNICFSRMSSVIFHEKITNLLSWQFQARLYPCLDLENIYVMVGNRTIAVEFLFSRCGNCDMPWDPSDRLETVVPRVGKRLTLLLVKGDMLMQLAEQLFFYYIIITRISLH
jgi:hypothetical protein